MTVTIEGHRESGALVGLADLSGATLHIPPHREVSCKLAIEEDTAAAWARVREEIPSSDLPQAIAVAAAQECTIADQLRTTARPIAYPTRDPWFTGEVAEFPANLISLVNASEAPVRVTACYSNGNLFSVNGAPLQPVCTATLDVQVPPFNSRHFPVSKDGSTRLALKTKGETVVLEMLRPLAENLRVYAVDSSIKFGEEAKP